MDKNYWLNRWQRGDTTWHQVEVEPVLVSEFKDLKPTRVFVPLCGKTLDLKWLASQGHEVIGVELSEQACREFFEENKIKFEQSKSGAFTAFRGAGITIYNGDVFDIGCNEVPGIGAVYDRAALIALPPEIRVPYAAHLIRLVRECRSQGSITFLEVVLERVPSDNDGPPFSVSAQEISTLYGADFAITPVSREKVDLKDAFECVYRLILKT